MMAVVLSSEENSYFSPSSLRRSHSQPNFVTKQSSPFKKSPSSSRISEQFQHPIIAPDSSPSSAPSSPQTIHAESSDISYSSTPATAFSLDSDYGDGDPISDSILLPSYGAVPLYNQFEDLEPPSSPRTGDSFTVSSSEQDSSTNASRPLTPELLERAEDDTAVRHHPSQHVDYLSHNWREEDIWSSWRYIVSKRGDYTNGARLENASWRTWMKAKYGLKTVSPETLNWLKDCDVTWLYGPLQLGSTKLHNGSTGPNSSALSRTNSFINKKPILKKRSMSEVMLQKSISSSSLLKQATASVQAQQTEHPRPTRPILQRATTDFMTYPFSSRQISREDSSVDPSLSSSGIISPSGEKKHIHFDEQVQQCIAVEIKGDDDEDEELGDRYNYDSDSDEGGVMMKRSKSKKPLLKRKSTPKPNADNKTIAMLPSTTLKYRADTPEPPETAMKHSTGTLRSPHLSPSSSQETLRPSKPSKRFFVDDDGDEEDDDYDPGTQFRQSGLQKSASSNSLNAEPAG